MGKVRALIALRLSRVTEESTSIERQREECLRLCEARGYAVVGEANDPDVSAGKTSPFDRPELGRWLKSPELFDVVVFYRADRVVRSARHLAELMSWAEDHAVSLVSATESHFDTSANTGGMGRMFANITAMFAEMELEAIRDRTRGSWHHLSQQGLATGSLPVFGYESYYDDAEEVTKYRVDPKAASVVREVAARVLAGEGMPAIARDLTGRGVLSPRDYHRVKVQGRDASGFAWSTSSLKRVLRNPGLQGYAVFRERVLDGRGQPKKDTKGNWVYGDVQIRRKDDGSPVVRAEAVLEPVQWKRLQDELDRREVLRQQPNENANSLLLHVLTCALCGSPFYRLKGFNGRVDRYRCKSFAGAKDQRCGNGSVPLREADELVSGLLLSMFGSSRRQVRTWDPGEDHTSELEQVNAELDDLAGQVGKGAYRAGTPQRLKLDARIDALADRQQVLEANPSRSAGWRYEPTDEIFSDWWAGLSMIEANQYLRDMGVSAVVSKQPREDATYEVEFGDLAKIAAGVKTDAVADEYLAGRPLGSLAHTDGFTVFDGRVSGKYDELRAEGFTVFAEVGGEVFAGKSADELRIILESMLDK